MREIKFRAWEKSLQEIIPVHNIDFSSRQINCNSAWRLFDEIELMQYTGLKDKNGKEVFEGDIVRAWSEGVCGIFEIRWRQEGSPCWILYPAWRPGYKHIWSLFGSKHSDGNYYDSIEVLGNIYENPELLEQQQ